MNHKAFLRNFCFIHTSLF